MTSLGFRSALLAAFALTLVLSSALPAAHAQQLFDLETRYVAEAPDRLRSLGAPTGLVSVSAESPVALKAEPQYTSTPMYACVTAGGRYARMSGRDSSLDPDSVLVMVFDETERGKGYDVLYIDANRDLRLTADEKVLAETPRRRGLSTVSYGPVTAIVPGPVAEPQPILITCYQMTAEFEALRRAPMLYASVVSGTYHEGEVGFGDTIYRIALCDGNQDGDFNDAPTAERYFDADRMLIDEDGDGRFDTSMTVGLPILMKFIRVGDQYYEIDVKPDGTRIRVTPYTGALGSVQTSMEGWGALLVSADGAIGVRDGAKTMSLPAGEYRAVFKMTKSTGEDGRVWFLSTTSEGTGTLRVEPGRTAKLPLGGPLVQRVETEVADGAVSISLRLTDAAGDRVSVLMAGSDHPAAPTFKIVSAAGKTVGSGSLEYG